MQVEIEKTAAELHSKSAFIVQLETQIRDQQTKWDLERSALMKDCANHKNECRNLQATVEQLKKDLTDKTSALTNKSQVNL